MLKLFVVPFEALAIAEGRTMVCMLEDGREVEVRIPTLDEARTAHMLACLATGAPQVADAELEKMLRPVKVSPR